jgi:hypothetical protein
VEPGDGSPDGCKGDPGDEARVIQSVVPGGPGDEAREVPGGGQGPRQPHGGAAHHHGLARWCGGPGRRQGAGAAAREGLFVGRAGTGGGAGSGIGSRWVQSEHLER